MVSVTRVVLDVLKPHHPNALEFAKAIASVGSGYQVTVNVTAVDEKTESVVIVVQGSEIDFDRVVEAVSTLGGSVHSIDEVEVVGVSQPAQ